MQVHNTQVHKFTHRCAEMYTGTHMRIFSNVQCLPGSHYCRCSFWSRESFSVQRNVRQQQLCGLSCASKADVELCIMLYTRVELCIIGGGCRAGRVDRSPPPPPSSPPPPSRRNSPAARLWPPSRCIISDVLGRQSSAQEIIISGNSLLNPKPF